MTARGLMTFPTAQVNCDWWMQWKLLNAEFDILIIQSNIMTFNFIILTLSAETKWSAHHHVTCACYGSYALNLLYFKIYAWRCMSLLCQSHTYISPSVSHSLMCISLPLYITLMCISLPLYLTLMCISLPLYHSLISASYPLSLYLMTKMFPNFLLWEKKYFYYTQILLVGQSSRSTHGVVEGVRSSVCMHVRMYASLHLCINEGMDTRTLIILTSPTLDWFNCCGSGQLLHGHAVETQKEAGEGASLPRPLARGTQLSPGLPQSLHSVSLPPLLMVSLLFTGDRVAAFHLFAIFTSY